MALDRESIERKDFPVGPRGYDSEAVDAHLSALAAEVAELRSSARRRNDTLASSASEQVRAIVEAAEASAAEIQRDAKADAQEIRHEADSEARATRAQATDQAREYVGAVSESTDTMLKRLDAMQSELDSLVQSLRTGSERLSADLTLLQGNLTDVSGVMSPPPRLEPEVEAPAARVPAAASAGATDEDGEGARLIALNMALSGTPREEAARYLQENFASLPDPGGLLDDVYASVEG